MTSVAKKCILAAETDGCSIDAANAAVIAHKRLSQWDMVYHLNEIKRISRLPGVEGHLSSKATQAVMGATANLVFLPGKRRTKEDLASAATVAVRVTLAQVTQAKKGSGFKSWTSRYKAFNLVSALVATIGFMIRSLTVQWFCSCYVEHAHFAPT